MDYQPAVAQCAGIGRYTKVLASELVKILSPEDELRLFYCDFKRKSSGSGLSGARDVAFHAIPGAVMQKLWHQVHFPPFNWFSGKADIFHFTNFTDRPLSRGKSVVTIHDMSFERYPQFAEKRNLRYLCSGLRRTVRNTDAIIAVSEFSKAEVESLLPDSSGKVTVVYPGIGSAFSRATDAQIEAVKKKIGLTRPFILTLGTLEPRKNLGFLMNVFEKVAPQGIDLVVSGAPGWKCEGILDRFAQTKYPKQFHYLRFVPDGFLKALYSAAALFVIPSFYEGFGFPPLEAMACGTPVLSSSGGSLPEVLGSAACTMKGFEVEEWASEILGILGNQKRRDEMTERGVLNASRFSWKSAAVQTLGVYRKVLGR